MYVCVPLRTIVTFESVGKTIYIFLVETKKIKFTRKNANTNRILNEIILNTKQ